MLLFDYDGVLLNSVVEMGVTAYNSATGQLITAPEQMPGNAAGLFLTNRYHVQPAGDAITLMAWIVAHADLAPDHRLSPEEYRSIKDSADTPLIERTAHFFATRRKFVEHDPIQWRALNSVYHPLWDILCEKGAHRVVILTNKNREATLTLCHHFGLAIPAENVYSGDNSVTKIENMLQIHDRFKRESYTFVDDSVGNLNELDAYFNPERQMLRMDLASWGYTGPEDELLAAKAGYRYITQDDLIHRLDAELPAGVT